MTAPSPRDELRAAAARLAAVLGWPPPEELTIKFPGQPPFPVRLDDDTIAPPALKRSEELVLQAIRTAGCPLLLKNIQTATELKRTAAAAAVAVLQRWDMIRHVVGQGYEIVED